MFYTYCPTLMNEIPQKTVDTLISLGRWFILKGSSTKKISIA